MRTKPLLLSAALLPLVLLAACSHSSGSGSSGGAAVGSNAGRAGSSVTGVADDRAAAPAAPTTNGSRSAGKIDPAGTPLAVAKIRTAQLTVAVRGSSQVSTQADRAGDIAEQAGGEVDTDDRTSGKDARATLRLRVPPDQLRPVLTALGRLGAERDRTSSADDVTEKVADVDARVASARDAIGRLQTLYSRAGKISDVIAVEAQLSSRQADLESLEAQQRALSRQTAMAAVNLNLVTAASTPTQRPDKYAGVVGGLRRGWDGFVVAARAVGTALGAMLPFLAVLAALALIARFVFGLRIGARRQRPRGQ